MLKVAILDDYQNISQQFVDIEKLSGKYEFKIFSEPFVDEAEAVEKLSSFEALLIMRERTPITKNLIDNLTKLKFIITSGLRNRSIDLNTAKKRKIIVCGTEMNLNPTPELTWSLILGLARNLKEEIDKILNWFQGNNKEIQMDNKFLQQFDKLIIGNNLPVKIPLKQSLEIENEEMNFSTAQSFYLKTI